MEIDVYKEWLGIPEGDRPPDHYALLRLIQFEDSVEKIRNNYKKLNGHVRKYAAGQYSVQSQALLNELAKAMLCLTDVDRKLDYDRTLGRVIEEASVGGRPALEKSLVSKDHVSADQMRSAKSFAEKTGIELRDAVVQLKFCDAAVATQALADELGLPFVDLNELVPEDFVLDRVPAKLAKLHSVLPLMIDEDVLLVACAHALDHNVEDELRLRFNGIPVRTALANPQSVTQGIARYYAPGARQDVASTGGKTNTKKAAAAKPAARKQQSTLEPLDPETQRQNKLLGAIAICWSLIGVSVLDWFVLGPSVLLDGWGLMLWFGALPVLGVAIWAAFYRR